MPTAFLLLLLTLSSSTVTVFSARMESESGDRTCTKISKKTGGVKQEHKLPSASVTATSTQPTQQSHNIIDSLVESLC